MDLRNIQCANSPSIPLSTLNESEQEKEIIELCKKLIKVFKES